MANCMFCWPDWSQPTAVHTPTFTGPAWLDLDLLQGEVLSEMARCPSNDPADTRLVLDMGTTRAVRVVAVPAHTAKQGALYRMRIANDADGTDVVADSGWREVWPSIYPFGALPWGSEMWWGGYLSEERAAGYRLPILWVLPAEVYGRYVIVEFDIAGTAADSLDVARIVVSSAWQPENNMSYGMGMGWVDDSPSQRSRGGVKFFDRQTRYRRFRFTLDWLGVAESLAGPFEMGRLLGKTEPFLFVFDPDDPAMLVQTSMWCTMRELSAIDWPYFEINKTAFELEEVI